MLEINKIYCMDCLEGMKQLPDGSVDLIATDVPYNTGMIGRTQRAWLSGFFFDALDDWAYFKKK